MCQKLRAYSTQLIGFIRRRYSVKERFRTWLWCFEAGCVSLSCCWCCLCDEMTTLSLSFPSLSCCALSVWSSSECWNLIGMYSQSKLSLQPWFSLVVTSTTNNFSSQFYLFFCLFQLCFISLSSFCMFLPKLWSKCTLFIQFWFKICLFFLFILADFY